MVFHRIVSLCMYWNMLYSEPFDFGKSDDEEEGFTGLQFQNTSSHLANIP